ncbi:hypothetical protein ASZ90_016504 [hydrocarbon metagenome]|uniref:Uncharacterized protein n=1 Tax=hydrocarbon metagenome TaxID=938273 RepID=A0A0W8ES98_9ZZZZ
MIFPARTSSLTNHREPLVFFDQAMENPTSIGIFPGKSARGVAW